LRASSGDFASPALKRSKQIARARLEREHGAIVKDHAGRLKIALVYPNSYEIGMSNLGFLKVYSLLNARDDVVCERAFVESAGRRGGGAANGPIVTIESQTLIGEFDVIAFSITFEADLINVLKALGAARVPLRGRGETGPLVIAGGICVTLNPEPLTPFIDVAVIGEGEGVIDKLVDAIIRDGLRSYQSFAQVPGVYIPSAYTPVYGDDDAILRYETTDGFPQRVKRAWNMDFAASPNESVIQTDDTVFGGMYLVEVGKGCGKHCRFCAAGYVYRPTRHAQTEAILSAIERGLKLGRRIGLMGSAVGDHPDVEKIFAYIVEKGGKFSVSSLRLDRLTDTLLENLASGGLHTVTVAPEAGSETLRKKVNKDLPEETILNAIRMIGRAGPFHLKLYFLVGLPGETDEDVAMIPILVEKIRLAIVETSRERGTLGSITAGVDAFVPKPVTPFEREPFGGVKSVEKKLRAVTRALRAIPNVTVQTGSARTSFVHALLSVGDRRVADILQTAYETDADWRAAMRGALVDPAFFVERRKADGEILPWSLIDHGLYEGYLAKEKGKSLVGKVTPECPPPGDDCRRCGSFDGVCFTEKKCV
jgi:radical SAM superfamily enzyme YgiQ (UPF0313 family)